MKAFKIYFIIVFILIFINFFKNNLPVLISDTANYFMKPLDEKIAMASGVGFYNFTKFVDKNVEKGKDVYFSLPSQYHQFLANYFLYPRRIYIDPIDIRWTNTIVSYDTIPNIIYIPEGKKSEGYNIFWIQGGEGIEGSILSKRNVKLARIDLLLSCEKWHKSGELVLEIFDKGKLLKKIVNKKSKKPNWEYINMKRNEEEKLSAGKFIIDPPISLLAYKEYNYRLRFKGNAYDLIGLVQEIKDHRIETKKMLYEFHPYYKLSKSFGKNRNIYTRGQK